MWTVQGIGATEARPGHSRNEDIFLVDDAQGLYAVADGFGGHPAGEVASAAAVATAARALRAQRAATDPDALDLTGSLERAVQHACGEVYAMAAARPEWGGMCCSLTLALVVGEQAAVAHVGNSRLYLVRRGSLHRLTTDHTLPAALASSGAIPADEATAHPFSHVLTRSIGSHEAVLVDTLVFDLAPGDRLLLCTRGLANLLDAAPELVIEAVEDQDLDGLAQWLIDQANTREPEGDLSAVVIAAGPQDGDVEGTDTHRKLGALGAPFLFEALELPQLSQILAACTLEAYGPGEVVVATGAPLDRLCRLHRRRGPAALVVVVMDADVPAHERLRVRRCGCDPHLARPVAAALHRPPVRSLRPADRRRPLPEHRPLGQHRRNGSSVPFPPEPERPIARQPIPRPAKPPRPLLQEDRILEPLPLHPHPEGLERPAG